MDAKQLMLYQLESSGHQVDEVLKGLNEAHWDAKVRDGCMTVRETVPHLTECYIAARKDLEGQPHEWGSYLAADDAPAAIVAEMQSERQRVWEALMAADIEKAGKVATQFIILHDAYHVGQLCAIRMAVEPAWDPYAIYA
jgi:hypothetical protein